MSKDVGSYRWESDGEMVRFVGGEQIWMAGSQADAEVLVLAHNTALDSPGGPDWGSAGCSVYMCGPRGPCLLKDDLDAREIAECHNRCLSELRGEHVPAGQVDLDDPKAVLCRFMRALGLRVSFSAGEAGTRWVAAVEREDVTVSERDAKALIEVARGLA